MSRNSILSSTCTKAYIDTQGAVRYLVASENISASDGRSPAGDPGVVVFFNDILITGSTEEEYLKTLEVVLSHLEKAG